MNGKIFADAFPQNEKVISLWVPGIFRYSCQFKNENLWLSIIRQKEILQEADDRSERRVTPQEWNITAHDTSAANYRTKPLLRGAYYNGID